MERAMTPAGIMLCSFVDEQEMNEALLQSRPFHPYYTPSEYFLVKDRKEGDLIQGHLGRIDRSDPFFNEYESNLTYFIDYKERKNIYFSFDKIELYQVIEILPYRPLLFTLKKVNLKAMQEKTPLSSGNITINAGHGNTITTGNYNSVTSNYSVSKGNVADLQNALRKCNVTEEDISEISKIVQEETPDSNGKFGSKTNTWLTKMMQKSIDGSWEIGIATAGGLLVEILKGFFG